ncbi:MAG TPA: restriction endonuclease subunit S [Spirochaetota bacterium]|nr:restriction endonuclease subunit S [Spirochaetota bacterium]
MEVKPGYKQTEVDVIPEDWNLEYVENLAYITTGGKNTQDRVEDGLYPFFVRSQNIERINSYSFDGEAVLTAGDGVGTGKVFHYINGKFDVHQRVYRISDFKEGINGFFFYLYFSSHFYNRIMQMTAKSSVDSVRRDMIARMQIPLPPTLAEQEAIAGALSDADALIESLEQIIAKKRLVKQGAMQRLLSPPEPTPIDNGELKMENGDNSQLSIVHSQLNLRLPGFSGEWEEKRLGQIGTFLKGSGVSREQSQSGKIPCVRYGEIYTHHEYFIKSFNSWISHDVAATATRLQHGDILFAGSGETKEEIGKCVAFVDDIEAYAGGDIVILRTENVDPLYLGYYLNTAPIIRQKASRGQGDAIVHISGTSLSEIQGLFPSLSEQTAIAAILSDMDAEIAALEEKLAKARQVKQGMMQELLTGRIRLV